MVQSIANISRLARQVGMADESHYFLQLEDYEDGAFLVESVKIDQCTIDDANSVVEVKVLTMNALSPKDILNKKAVIKFLWRSELSSFFTIVSEIFEANSDGEYFAYLLKLRCPLSSLKHQSENRVFLDTSSLEIAKTLLANFAQGAFPVEVVASAPATREMIIQYQESDWDFLYRILLQDGIMIHSHHDGEKFCVYLINDVAQLPTIKDAIVLPYRSLKGTAAEEEYISSVRSHWQITPSAVQVSDYQFNDSQIVNAREETGSAGKHVDYRWADNMKDSDSAQSLAERISIAHRATESTLFMETTCRGLKAGMLISLTGHPEWSGDYLIIKFSCEGQQLEATNGGTSGQSRAYKNTLLVIPTGQAYLPLLPARAKVTGTLTGAISAEVNDAGYYEVRLPFDSTSSDEHTSLPLRMLQPFGGRDHGMHFPLLKGTEIVVGFENGDIDRPFILGASQNAINPSVVTSENSFQNLIRTRSQHEFLLDDSPNEELIRLNTAKEKNRLRLDATKGNHLAELHTEEGDVKITAGMSISLESGENMSVDVGGDQEITVNGDYKLLSEEGDIIHEAGANIHMTASENIEWSTESGDMTIAAAGQWQVEVDQGSSTHIVNGDKSVLVDNGGFLVEAGNEISMFASDSILISQGSGSISIDNQGNISLEGPQIEIIADKIAIKGGSVSNN